MKKKATKRAATKKRVVEKAATKSIAMIRTDEIDVQAGKGTVRVKDGRVCVRPHNGKKWSKCMDINELFRVLSLLGGK